MDQDQSNEKLMIIGAAILCAVVIAMVIPVGRGSAYVLGGGAVGAPVGGANVGLLTRQLQEVEHNVALLEERIRIVSRMPRKCENELLLIKLDNALRQAIDQRSELEAHIRGERNRTHPAHLIKLTKRQRTEIQVLNEDLALLQYEKLMIAKQQKALLGRPRNRETYAESTRLMSALHDIETKEAAASRRVRQIWENAGRAPLAPLSTLQKHEGDLTIIRELLAELDTALKVYALQRESLEASPHRNAKQLLAKLDHDEALTTSEKQMLEQKLQMYQKKFAAEESTHHEARIQAMLSQVDKQLEAVDKKRKALMWRPENAAVQQELRMYEKQESELSARRQQLLRAMSGGRL